EAPDPARAAAAVGAAPGRPCRSRPGRAGARGRDGRGARRARRARPAGSGDTRGGPRVRRRGGAGRPRDRPRRPRPRHRRAPLRSQGGARRARPRHAPAARLGERRDRGSSRLRAYPRRSPDRSPWRRKRGATMPGGGSESKNGNGGGSGAVLELVKNNKEVLASAAVSAVGAVAARKGPQLVRRLVESTENRGEEEASRLGEKAAEGATEGLGGGGGLAGKAVKVLMGGGGSDGSGGKKTRRLPIQRWTDVAVPVEKAYE